jgi:hypothetical protein
MKTVAELIEELKLLPQDANIYVWESGGLEDLDYLKEINVTQSTSRHHSYESVQNESELTWKGFMIV